MQDMPSDAYEYEYTIHVLPDGRRAWTVRLIVNGSFVAQAIGATHHIAEKAALQAYERCYVPALGRPRRLTKRGADSSAN